MGEDFWIDPPTEYKLFVLNGQRVRHRQLAHILVLKSSLAIIHEHSAAGDR